MRLLREKLYRIRKERAKDESLGSIIFKEKEKRSLKWISRGISKHVRKRIDSVWSHRSHGKEKWSTIKFVLA